MANKVVYVNEADVFHCDNNLVVTVIVVLMVYLCPQLQAFDLIRSVSIHNSASSILPNVLRLRVARRTAAEVACE